jgi:hypothetical protein
MIILLINVVQRKKGKNLDAFFWVIHRRLWFKCQRFRTLFHLHRRVGMKYRLMEMEQAECSES